MKPGTLQLTQFFIQALLVVLGSGVVSTAIALFFNRRQRKAEAEFTEAETRQKHVETDGLIFKQMQEKVAYLVTEVDRLRKADEKKGEQISFLLRTVKELQEEVEKWKRMFFNLYNWVRQKGQEPPTIEELQRELE